MLLKKEEDKKQAKVKIDHKYLPFRSSPAKKTVVSTPHRSTSVAIKSVTASSLYTTSEPMTEKKNFMSGGYWIILFTYARNS